MLDRVSPNAITFTRIALIPVLVPLLLVRDEYSWGAAIAFTLFALLSITDGLDGYVARSRNKVTRLGVFLDPLADKLLVTAALVSLVQINEIAAWVVVLILSREFAVTGLRAIAASEGVVIAAHWLGKLKTVAQILLVLILILPDTSNLWADLITGVTVALTIGSGAEYFWKARDLLRDPSSDTTATDSSPGRVAAASLNSD